MEIHKMQMITSTLYEDFQPDIQPEHTWFFQSDREKQN